MPSIEDALSAAITLLEDEGDDDNAEELNSLRRAYQSRQGDNPEQARSRALAILSCGNCDFEWPGFAYSTEIIVAMPSMTRHAQCPRCYETDKVNLRAGGP